MRFPSPRSLLAVVGTLVLFCLACAVYSQSGRRLPNSKSIPVPVPTPQPTATPKVAVEKPKPVISVVVGIDSDSFFGIPLQYYDVALDACAARIGRSPLVTVAGRQTRMARSEAIRQAKAEKESYVVWLQLRGDSMDADRSVHNLTEILLDYVMFAPVTAKQVTAGRTYQNANSKGRVIVNPRTTPRTGDVYGEYLIREAAREAGERILSALHVPTGRTLPQFRSLRSMSGSRRSEIRRSGVRS